MSSGISAPVSRPIASYFPSESKATRRFISSFVNVNPLSIASSDFKLRFSERERYQRRKWICNSSGDNESKSVLDAFFLGKAIGEALTERIESTVGEFLSVIGRLQSEQQKQVQEFQDEVLERAKRAKERAAREAMEAQGLISRPATIETTPLPNGTTSAAYTSTRNGDGSEDKSSEEGEDNSYRNQDLGVSNED